MSSNSLTPRELQVVRYSHLTFEEMGEKLGISPRTAKYDTDRVRWKLGVRHKRHLQDRCRELGIRYD